MASLGSGRSAIGVFSEKQDKEWAKISSESAENSFKLLTSSTCWFLGVPLDPWLSGRILWFILSFSAPFSDFTLILIIIIKIFFRPSRG